jgi:uncharacterized protein
LIVSGFFFTGLGFLGIIIPLLPTTPFLLLAAACFANSSDRFYEWLMNNRWLGKYIRDYREKRGMKLRSKIFSLSLLNITIAYSVVFATENIMVRIVLICVAVGVSIHLLLLNTLKD